MSFIEINPHLDFNSLNKQEAIYESSGRHIYEGQLLAKQPIVNASFLSWPLPPPPPPLIRTMLEPLFYLLAMFT